MVTIIYGIRFKNYNKLNSLQIEEFELEQLSNTLSFHELEIIKQLEIKDYRNRLINDFNAIIYDYRKTIQKSDVIFSEVIFKKQEDAQDALDWLISLVLALKLFNSEKTDNYTFSDIYLFND